MQVILIGYRGCGKSTVARILARSLKAKLVDTDEEIEKSSGMSIPQIVEKEGWAGFRKREAAQVKAALKQQAVIAVGGGALTENKISLPKQSIVVLLTATHSAIALRIKGTDRPALKKDSVREIKEVLQKRMPKYLKIADIVIDTTGKKPQKTANEILKVIT